MVSLFLRGWLVCTDGRKAGQKMGRFVKPQKHLSGKRAPLAGRGDTE